MEVPASVEGRRAMCVYMRLWNYLRECVKGLVYKICSCMYVRE